MLLVSSEDSIAEEEGEDVGRWEHRTLPHEEYREELFRIRISSDEDLWNMLGETFGEMDLTKVGREIE